MFAEALAQVVRSHPDRVAIRGPAGAVTYGELACAYEHLADGLCRRQIGRGQTVGLLADNGHPFVTALFGIYRAGGLAVLYPTHAKAPELAQLLAQGGTRWVLVAPRLQSLVVAAGGEIVESVAPGLLLTRFSQVEPLAGAVREGDLLAQFTSGVSGPSRLAVRTEAAVWDEIEAVRQVTGMTSEDRVLCLPPIFHSFGLCGGTLAPLACGASVTYAEFLPDTVFRLLRTERPTIMFAVPVMYSLLAGAHKEEPLQLDHLRLAFTAGSMLTADLIARVRAGLGIALNQDYGSTEAGTNCLDVALEGGPGSVGPPLPGRRFRVVNEEGAPLPPGERGHLQLQSRGLARAFLWPPDSPTAGPDGWYPTGDLGYVDERGCVYITGRRSITINVAGKKVSPEEVEAVVADLAGVREVVAFGVPHATAGEVVKLVVVPDRPLAIREIIDWCAARLAGHKVPRQIEFRSELPRSASGKILRKYLMEGGNSLD